MKLKFQKYFMKFDLLLGFLSILIISCSENVIDIDLSVFDKSIVIEGIVSNKPGPTEVKISRVESYFEDNISVSVSGADVEISDDLGNNETLAELPGGIYRTNAIHGTPGRTYYLKVSVGGKEYHSTSKMPEPMEFSSIKSEYEGYNNYNLLLSIEDKKNVEEYCRIKIYVNGNFKNDKKYQDSNSDGEIVTIKEQYFNYFDQATIELVTITKDIYKYFSDLDELSNSDDSETTELIQLAAGNPKSNISNNALGYFSAQTYKKYIKLIN